MSDRTSPLCGGPFLGSQAIAAGLITRAALRGDRWRHLFHDVYVAADAADTYLLRIQGAALRLPTGAVITGRSAAHLWGVGLSRPDRLVEVQSPLRMHRARGFIVHSGPLACGETTTRHGVPVCSPEHAAWQISRFGDRYDAAGWIDALAGRRQLSTESLVAHAGLHPLVPGTRRAAAALARCDRRAESPPESKLRLLLVDHGLPPAEPQFTVLIDGRFVARVDLAWPWLRIAIEYDGQWHATPEQLAQDRTRLRALTAAGWLVFHVTSRDMQNIPALMEELSRLFRTRSTQPR